MIPTNLVECFIELKKIGTYAEIKEFQQVTEQQIVLYHHGIGRWIRNNWGLWEGGPLQDYFKEMGLWHADDMSGIILKSFHRHINNQPLNVEEQVQYYKDFWNKK